LLAVFPDCSDVSFAVASFSPPTPFPSLVFRFFRVGLSAVDTFVGPLLLVVLLPSPAADALSWVSPPPLTDARVRGVEGPALVGNFVGVAGDTVGSFAPPKAAVAFIAKSLTFAQYAFDAAGSMDWNGACRFLSPCPAFACRFSLS
jgi:hypothetical protein